ncbi:hypothetical protein [Actinomadura harenae]|uniref:hypothetical protein n=1 Tax=Actinomadura harenae TaxID=2483351 RepID=UPI0013155CC0|nr:hypothetical protein [Actinomadura harenae]
MRGEKADAVLSSDVHDVSHGGPAFWAAAGGVGTGLLAESWARRVVSPSGSPRRCAPARVPAVQRSSVANALGSGIAMLLPAQVGTHVLPMPVSGAAADRIPHRTLLVGPLLAFGAIGAAQTALVVTGAAMVAARVGDVRGVLVHRSPPKKASSGRW